MLNSDGSFTYTPDEGFTGWDAWGYEASDGEALSGGVYAAPTSEELGSLLQVAVAQWFVAGTPATALQAALTDVEIRVVDLPDNKLAAFSGGVILIDTDAAGHGWFIDSTPWRSEEFPLRTARSERRALPGGAAFGHVDLLTVLTHEIGHALGFEHEAGRREAHHVMNEVLGLGTRRSPVPDESANTGPAAREEYFRKLAIDQDYFRQTRRIRFGSCFSGSRNEAVEEFFAHGGFAGE